MTCPHCERPAYQSGVTCLRSACQQAEYRACLERAALRRGGRMALVRAHVARVQARNRRRS